MILDDLERLKQGHNIYNSIIYMPIMAIYVDRKLHTVPCDIFTLNDLDFGLNNNCANISLTIDLKQFVYIEDI